MKKISVLLMMALLLPLPALASMQDLNKYDCVKRDNFFATQESCLQFNILARDLLTVRETMPPVYEADLKSEYMKIRWLEGWNIEDEIRFCPKLPKNNARYCPRISTTTNYGSGYQLEYYRPYNEPKQTASVQASVTIEE